MKTSKYWTNADTRVWTNAGIKNRARYCVMNPHTLGSRHSVDGIVRMNRARCMTFIRINGTLRMHALGMSRHFGRRR